MHVGPIIGPLFLHDLAQLARRGRPTTVRVAYGLLLLSGLAVIYVRHYSHNHWFANVFAFQQVTSISEQASFTTDAVSILMVLQGAVVFALTPAYLATAITEDREHPDLEFLLTTQLLNREIVLGKLGARLAFIGSIIMTGLPILCLMQLWGAVGLEFMLANFVVALLALLSVGSLSILCSSVSGNEVTAVVSSYVMVIVFALICHAWPSCSPTTFSYELDRRFDTEIKERRQIISSSRPVSGPPIRI
jgi:ABC-type transport system involved in multi-copper enzyme maturation permease subunit